MLDADPDGAAEQIDRIDADLRTRIRRLEERRGRLRRLDRPDQLCLPSEANEYLERLRTLGLTERHERAIRDGWILTYALAPDLARAVLPSRTALLDDPDQVAVLRGYDDAIDWSPTDPRLGALADAAADLARRMTLPSDLPDFQDVPRHVVDLLAGHQGIGSPAWRRLDQLVTERLAVERPAGPCDSSACGSRRAARHVRIVGHPPYSASTSAWEGASMAARPRHPDKDLEAVLRSLERCGWRIERGQKYYKTYCPCGSHKKTVHLTPSGSRYRLNLVRWLRRETCWEEERRS